MRIRALPPFINGQLGKAGYELRRSDASRRSSLLNYHRIDLVLDVGAARGAYALQLRRHGYAGRIISFEPLADAFRDLSKQASRDPRWTAVNSALGADAERRIIHRASNSDSSSFLRMGERHRAAAPHVQEIGEEEVLVQRLDDLCLSDVGHAGATLLKLDTQGFEGAVLDGGALVLQQVKGVQIELSFVDLYEGSLTVLDAIDRLTRDGFRIEAIEPGLRDPRSQQLLQADALFFRG